MKNVPRRDTEKKLMAPGPLNTSKSSKNLVSPSLNIMRRDSEMPLERFNEDFLLPKPINLRNHNLATSTPETPSLIGSINNNGHSSYRSTHLKRDTHNSSDVKNGTPDTMTLLARMGYGGLQLPNQSMSTSLLASQREAFKNANAKKLSETGQYGNIGNTGAATTTLTSNSGTITPAVAQAQLNDMISVAASGSDEGIQQNTMGYVLQKETMVGRFHARSIANAKKRVELIHAMEKFSGDARKKLDHWNQLSHLIDSEIEDRLRGNRNNSGGVTGSITEIASVGEKYLELNGFMANLMKQIYAEYLANLEEANVIKGGMANAEAKIAAVTAQKDSFAEMLKEKNAILKKLLEIGDNEEMRSKKEKRANYVTVENTKLAAENMQLANKLHLLENGQDITLLRQQLKDTIADAEAKAKKAAEDIDVRDRELHKRKLQVSSLQTSLAKFELEVRQLRVKVNEQEQELVSLRVENQTNFDRQQHYRERLLMLSEDFSVMQQKTQEQRQLMQTLRETAQKLKAKLDRFTIARSKEVEVPNDGSFPNDLNMLQLMQGEFQKDRQFFKSVLANVNKQLEKKGKANGNTEYEVDHVKNKTLEVLLRFSEKPEASLSSGSGSNSSGNNSGSVEFEHLLPSLQISKPNFYVFVEVAAKNYELDMQNMKNRKISTSFIGNLRAILDSKYNEILMYESTPRQISKFADFAYAWLGKFTVDQTSRQIRLLHEAEKLQVDDARVIFLLDLTNPKLVGIWEVVTFKEFLNEKASSDEVYFYLHCRNLLFKGPCLMTRHEATFDVCEYVHASHAESLVELIMAKFDPVNVMMIKKQLKEKVKVKKEKSLIESGFVLRILLEFYRIEKRNRYKLLREAFLAQSAMGSQGKFCISFVAFKKILQINFTESTEQEIAEMYREAYSLGAGSVTIDLFYAVANDTGYFLRYLQLNSFEKAPVIDEKGQLVESVESNLAVSYFYNMVENIKGTQEMILQEAVALGVDRVYNEAEEINYQINHHFQQDVFDLRGKPFFAQVHRIMALWTQIKAQKAFAYNLQDPANKCGFEPSAMILKDFDTMARILSEFQDEYLQAKRIEALEKNNKFRKLQKLCRRKITKFYSFVSSLLSAKLKTAVRDKEKETNKIQRKQSFKNLEAPGTITTTTAGATTVAAVASATSSAVASAAQDMKKQVVSSKNKLP